MISRNYYSLLKRLQNFGWPGFLIAVLLLAEISIHPLGFGPDRRIHDPGAYREAESSYMAGDWYTSMADQSEVYTFYSPFITLGSAVGIPEEAWRLLWFVLSLIVLYGAMIFIARLFSPNPLVVPGVAVLHALLVTSAPPIWLYGPFIQIDGGLAPRSIGVALSFLALLFLLQKRKWWPWILLGVATLIHVSNSLIIFSLFFGAWFLQQAWLVLRSPKQAPRKALSKEGFTNILLYFVAGGWFAGYVALMGIGQASVFSDEKFIWTWIYFRAPYMALPLIPWRAWTLFAFHGVALVMAWVFLRQVSTKKIRETLDLLGLIGVGGLGYFFAFFFFAFVWPWLPAFQFYSIRVVYLTYFVTYLFLALSALHMYRYLEKRVSRYLHGRVILLLGITVILVAASTFIFLATRPGEEFSKRAPKNLHASVAYIQHPALPTPAGSAARYLAKHQEPFLAPIHWYGASEYLPHVASFKTFGFTKEGLEEWFERINDLSRGELQETYQQQRASGEWRPVVIDWTAHYRSFTAAEVLMLREKYHFQLFLTYKDLEYPFQVVAEDGDYRLYRLPKK